MTKPESLDCVDLKREGAERVQQRLAGLSRDEVLEYWRQQHELLLERQHAARAVNVPATAATNQSS